MAFVERRSPVRGLWPLGNKSAVLLVTSKHEFPRGKNGHKMKSMATPLTFMRDPTRLADAVLSSYQLPIVKVAFIFASQLSPARRMKPVGLYDDSLPGSSTRSPPCERIDNSAALAQFFDTPIRMLGSFATNVSQY